MNNNNSKVIKYAGWIIKKKWVVMISSILMVILTAYGIRFLTFNNDYQVFFGEDNPQLVAFNALQDKFTKDDNALVVIAPKEGDVFTINNLAAIEKLTEELWKTPYSMRVDGLTNFQYTYSIGDDMYVENLASDMNSKTESDLEIIKEVAAKDPLLLDRIINKEGTLTAINIAITLPGEHMNENSESVSFIRKTVEKWSEENSQFNIYYSGVIFMNDAFSAVSQHDFKYLVPLMFLVIIITMFIATKSISGTLASLFVLLFSVFTALGIAGWIKMQLTAVTVSVPTMVMTLAIADSIHILISMIHYMELGKAKDEAIIESLRINFAPVFITSITTAIGFLTMNLSDAPPFHDFGNMTAIGVMAAFVFSVTFLPAIMSILPVNIKVKEVESKKETLLHRLAEYIIHSNYKVLAGMVVIVVLVGSLSLKNEINANFIAFFDKSVPFRQDAEFVSENLTGIFTLEYSLGSGKEDGISDPRYLAKLEEFENWYRQQDHVIHVNSFHEVTRRTNRSMHGDSLSYYKIPENKQEAAQYLLLYEMSLPFGLDLNNQINVDKSESRFVVTLGNINSNQMIKAAEAGEQWLKENAPEYMFGYAISPGLMFAHLGNRQAYSMINGTGLALLLISLVLIFALRSIKFGLFSLIPNITPLLVGFGVWGVVDGMIHPGITIVFGMTLGIIVDDSVHFLTKYLKARREQGKSPAQAIHYAFSTIGKAIIITTIVLIAGFSILSQSTFQMNSGMAQLTSITVAIALIIDLILLPALLLVIDKEKAKTKAQDDVKTI